MTETLVAFAALLALAFARVPIAFAMLVVGATGFALTRGWHAAFDQVAQTTFGAGIDYELSVVPLFIGCHALALGVAPLRLCVIASGGAVTSPPLPHDESSTATRHTCAKASHRCEGWSCMRINLLC